MYRKKWMFVTWFGCCVGMTKTSHFAVGSFLFLPRCDKTILIIFTSLDLLLVVVFIIIIIIHCIDFPRLSQSF